MQQLFPSHVDDVDVLALYAADSRPAPTDRPWVMMNMISSADGGISIDGVSGGLGGPADKAVFTAIRAVADVILVASGTVRAENYRRPQTPITVQAIREHRGQLARPELAIVTGSLSLGSDHRVFDDNIPIVLTHAQAPAARRAELAPHAEILDAGIDSVDLGLALRMLRERGARTVLLEGGPTLNGHLVSAGLVDEVCLSLSPLLVGGRSSRIVASEGPGITTDLTLQRILQQDGLTFYRYTRT